MTCNFTDLAGCAKGIVGGAVSAVVPDAWDAICKSFADAAAELLKAFAKAFAALPDVNPASAGIGNVYAISLVLAGTVAALLMLGQVIRTAWTHDGSALAQGASGMAKAVVAWLATAAVAMAGLAASNQATTWIIQGTFGSQTALAVRLGDIVNWSIVAGQPGQAAMGASLLLIIAVIGIILVIVLWFELLLRNAAIAVLIAVSPLAAAGQISETTKVWWQRTVSAAVQLIILKPVLALVFSVGFAMAGNSTGVESLLEGLLVLILAVFCWPVIARFFTFATVQAANSGLGAALGFAAGRLSGGGGGQTAGIDPSQWSRGAESRTMAARGNASGAEGAEGAAAGAGSPASAGGAGGAGKSAGGGAGGAVLAGVGFALDAAHRAGSALAGRMEQTASHAGMHGAYPYSTVGGYRSGPGGSRPAGQPSQGGGASPGQETLSPVPPQEPGNDERPPASPPPDQYTPPQPAGPPIPMEPEPRYDDTEPGDQS